jgi:pyruvate dehydrogenase phosphatase
MKSGCTALVLDVDLNHLIGRYANAGDSRLVICSPLDHQIALQTCDLNTNTASERERLSREHPGEDSMFVHNRLFGRSMCTRGDLLLLTGIPFSKRSFYQGFGDGYYKFPKGLLGAAQHRKYIKTLSSVEKPGIISLIDQYDTLFYAYRTPPYVTARPDTGSPYQFKAGDIAILATDGLWDLVSSEDAVEIVLRGTAQGERQLARYLLEQVVDLKQPHDDVTIVILRMM